MDHGLFVPQSLMVFFLPPAENGFFFEGPYVFLHLR